MALDFDRFLRQICPFLELDWRKYRRRSARHRIARRMMQLELESYDSFLQHLRTDKQEAEGLADLMRVTVSRFFRNKTSWLEMAEKVLPELLAGKAAGSVFRVWSAGCCGGEEPFTMATLWLQYLQPRFPGISIDILATDIDSPSLERARIALYDHASLREVPPEIIAAWFRREKGRWLVDERVKTLVRFQYHNLMTDPPPYGIDLVLCRNLVFTYYRGNLQLTATRHLHAALRSGGLLMVGKSEKLGLSVRHLFEPWPGVAVAHRKI